MTVAVVALAVTVVFLVIALISMAGNANQNKEADNDTTGADAGTSQEIPLADADNVDISGLDGWRLISQADLEAGEIPDHYIGNEMASVVVIEYEDFACSYCQALSSTADQIHADYGDRVLFIHRSFSLGFLNSFKTLQAAEAAYLVGGQEAYWAMNKLLYQSSTRFTRSVKAKQAVYNGFAEEIGLNVDKFKEAEASVAVANKLERDKLLGKAAGITGTPSWFINGEEVTPSDSDIRSALDAALQ
jgi:protein-disulfide isomerase